jgi:PilZ domain
MPAQFLHGLLSACRHQFSWPRRDETGENYQVCVHCGARYSYDWTKMRRIALLENPEDKAEASRTTARKCGTRKAWMPRERRLRHQVPVLYRVPGSEEWLEGVTENISRSGLLFRASNPLEVGSAIELAFEMPHEVTGDNDARVICEGSLVRVETAATRDKKHSAFLMACAIKQYRFAAASDKAIVVRQSVS